jgi:hypothetical protein
MTVIMELEGVKDDFRRRSNHVRGQAGRDIRGRGPADHGGGGLASRPVAVWFSVPAVTISHF